MIGLYDIGLAFIPPLPPMDGWINHVVSREEPHA